MDLQAFVNLLLQRIAATKQPYIERLLSRECCQRDLDLGNKEGLESAEIIARDLYLSLIAAPTPENKINPPLY